MRGTPGWVPVVHREGKRGSDEAAANKPDDPSRHSMIEPPSRLPVRLEVPLPWMSEVVMVPGRGAEASCPARGVDTQPHRRRDRRGACGAVVRVPWTTVPVESLFARLEPLLPGVSKPIQYVGGELHSAVKDWDSADVRWALMYPDAYEVGLPNQGVQILYEVLNERDDTLAERTYSVWPDMEAVMREHAIPQFTVDAHRPVRSFDVFGISFATELGYTNLLTALDLAGIPLEAADRGDDDPI